jgi:hypothetical protein
VRWKSVLSGIFQFCFKLLITNFAELEINLIIVAGGRAAPATAADSEPGGAGLLRWMSESS